MTRHFLAIAFVALSARQPAPTGRDVKHSIREATEIVENDLWCLEEESLLCQMESRDLESQLTWLHERANRRTGRDGPVTIVPSVVTASAFTGPVGPNRLAQWAAMVNQAVVLRGDCFEIECRVVEATGFEACVSQAKAWCLFGRMDLRDVAEFQNGIR